jgi:hypothetical protein
MESKKDREAENTVNVKRERRKWRVGGAKQGGKERERHAQRHAEIRLPSGWEGGI